MASKKKKATAAAGGAVGAAKAAKDNPYVQRIVEDDDLRDTIQEAYEAARSAYDRLSSGKGSPAKQLLDDQKLHKELKQAAESIRDASSALRDAPKGKAKKKGGLLRKVTVLAVAGGLALALSEDLRKKVLDLLFGAEEEFEYTSTTTPPPPGGATPGGTPEAATAS